MTGKGPFLGSRDVSPSVRGMHSFAGVCCAVGRGTVFAIVAATMTANSISASRHASPGRAVGTDAEARTREMIDDPQ